MARAPGVIRQGTAKDLAALGVGYSASGASEHSRHAAHSSTRKPRDEYANDFRPERPSNLSLGELIARTANQIAKLCGDILLEDDPERKAKLRKRRDLKNEVFERLKKENTK